MYHENITDNYFNYAGNVQKVNQELIALYASLDDTIKKCDFIDNDLNFIKLIQYGFTFDEIAKYKNIDNIRKVKNMFNRICKRIVKKNNEMWNINIIFNHIKTEWKKCNKCGEVLPVNENFFRLEETCKDGFRPECRKCERESDILRKNRKICGK